MSRFAPRFLPTTLRHWGLIALAASSVALTACGGGSRAKPYQPGAVVSLGDDYSAFGTDASTALDPTGAQSLSVKGLTYAVNPVSSLLTGYCTETSLDATCTAATLTGTFTVGSTTKYYLLDPVNAVNVVTRIDLGTSSVGTDTAKKRLIATTYLCNSPSTWSQIVARGLGLGYRSDCPTDLTGGTSYAAPGAKVANAATQLVTASGAGKLGSGVLVTVSAGQNDVLEVFASSATQASKIAEVSNRANALAQTVIGLLNTGAKVVVVGVPGLEYSPYAIAQTSSTGNCNTDRGDVTVQCNNDMAQLVSAFNSTLIIGSKSLGLKGLQDYATSGRQLAFVDAQAITRTYALTQSYAANARLCSASLMARADGTANSSSLLYCNSNTLDSALNASLTLWADDTHMGPVLHSALGSRAYTLVSNQF